MYVNWGNLHPFTWHPSKNGIRSYVTYSLTKIDFILLREELQYVNFPVTSAKLIDIVTGTEINCSIDSYSYTINGVQIVSYRIRKDATGLNSTYYLKVVAGPYTYYSDYIKFDVTCVDVVLTGLNSCSNSGHDWQNDISPPNFKPLAIVLNNAQQDVPNYETERESILTQYGEVQKIIRQKKTQKFEWVAPKGYWNLLNGFKELDTLTLNGKAIKNFDVEKQDVTETHSRFTILFEYDTINFGDTCCGDVNLDTIQNIDNTPGGAECEDFTVSLNYSNGILAPTLNNPPTGTIQYRWFRNGVLFSTASQINTNTPGDYRVDVLISGCRASDSFLIDNQCGGFSLSVYAVGNTINGDVNNVPDCDNSTVQIEVVLNNTVVGTSLPYVATQSGTYFIYARACDCVRSAGIFIQLQENNCDYDVVITRNSNQITAVATPSTGVTFNWKLIKGENVEVSLGVGATQTLSESGVYQVEANRGELCSKTYYYVYFADTCTPMRICNWDEMPGRYDLFEAFEGDDTSYSFTGTTILFSNINNPSVQLTVKRNGVTLNYVTGTPSDSGQYSISGNNLILWSSQPLEVGEILTVRLNT